MVDYKQILRLRAEGVSQRGIADALGCSRNTVAAVFTAANSAGVGFGQVADLGADEVRTLLLPEPARPDSDRAAPDFEYVHRELGRPSVTLLVLWNEYVAKCRATRRGAVPVLVLQRTVPPVGEVDGGVDADPAQPGRVGRGRLGRGPDGVRRPADRRAEGGVGVRGRVVVLGLLVCGGLPRHDARVVDRRARARVRALRGCRPAARPGQPAHRGVQVGPVRAGVEPGVRASGGALRHRGHPGPREASPRQAGRRRQCPVRRRAGRRGAPQPAVRRVGRVERGHLRRGRRHQRPTVPEAGGLPADRVRTRREAAADPAAAGPVRAGGSPQGQGGTELPRPGRSELLLGPRTADRAVAGCPDHLGHRGGLRRGRARRVPSAVQGRVRPVLHPARAHARLASQPAGGLDPGTVRAVGRDHRPEHGGRDPGDPRRPARSSSSPTGRVWG